MSSNEEPTRLLEDPETSDALRAALDAGRGDVPDAGQLSSLAAKLGPLLGGGGGDGDGGGGGGGGGDGAGGGGGDGGLGGAVPSTTASSGGAVVAKSLGALAITVALVTVGALSMREGTPGQTARRHEASGPEASRAVEAPATPDVQIALPRGVDVPESPEPPPVRPRRTPARPATDAPTEPATPIVGAPSLEVDPAAELALIRQAQDALRSSPARALELAETHERRFGDGALGQEREVVAIDALARLGRADAARARAARFSARWPTSAHRRRVEVILAR